MRIIRASQADRHSGEAADRAKQFPAYPSEPDPGQCPEAEAVQSARRLQTEYIRWRTSERLEPTAADLLRLGRWSRLAARQGGVLFAPWAHEG